MKRAEQGPCWLAPGDLHWPGAQVLDDLPVPEALVDVLEHDEPWAAFGELGGRHGGGQLWFAEDTQRHHPSVATPRFRHPLRLRSPFYVASTVSLYPFVNPG